MKHTVIPDSHAVVESSFWQCRLGIVEDLPGYLRVRHIHGVKAQLGVLRLVDLLEGLSMASGNGCPSIDGQCSIGSIA